VEDHFKLLDNSSSNKKPVSDPDAVPSLLLPSSSLPTTSDISIAPQVDENPKINSFSSDSTLSSFAPTLGSFSYDSENFLPPYPVSSVDTLEAGLGEADAHPSLMPNDASEHAMPRLGSTMTAHRGSDNHHCTQRIDRDIEVLASIEHDQPRGPSQPQQQPAVSDSPSTLCPSSSTSESD